MTSKENVAQIHADRRVLSSLGVLCEALCLVHNTRGDEGRRCRELGKPHESGFVLCWVHAQAMENASRNYKLVCRKRGEHRLKYLCHYCGGETEKVLQSSEDEAKRSYPIECASCHRHFILIFNWATCLVIDVRLVST